MRGSPKGSLSEGAVIADLLTTSRQSDFGDQAEGMDGMRDRLEKLNEMDELQIALNRVTAQMNQTGMETDKLQE